MFFFNLQTRNLQNNLLVTVKTATAWQLVAINAKYRYEIWKLS